MKKFTLAVHSLGNIGTRVVEAALAAPDCQCLGVIRRAESLGTQSHALRGLPEKDFITQGQGVYQVYDRFFGIWLRESFFNILYW